MFELVGCFRFVRSAEVTSGFDVPDRVSYDHEDEELTYIRMHLPEIECQTEDA